LILESSEDPSAYLEIDMRGGSVVYEAGMERYIGECDTPNLVSHSKAPDLAKDHLKALELLPENSKELVLNHVGGLAMASLGRDGTTSHYDKIRTVKFRRELDGISVMGPGSRIVVRMGEAGELNGMIWDWPEIKTIPIGLESVRNLEKVKIEAIDRIQRASEDANKVVVKEAKIVLFDDEQEVIEPAVYIEALRFYEGTIDQGEGESGEKVQYEIPCDFFLPLLVSSVAKFPDSESENTLIPADASINPEMEDEELVKDEETAETQVNVFHVDR
jgi:hypothetical protein